MKKGQNPRFFYIKNLGPKSRIIITNKDTFSSAYDIIAKTLQKIKNHDDKKQNPQHFHKKN